MKTLRGFTLIEVLIALVIAATALALGFESVSGSARRLGRVEEAALTRWVIENVVNDIALRAQAIEPGRHQFVETMLGRTLVADADVEREAKLPILRITVSVADASAPGNELDRDAVELVYAPAAP